MLVVMKGLLPLNIVETYGWSDLNYKRTHDLVFPSCKTLIEEVLPYMMICTFEKFVFPYVTIVVFVTPTFDLWMNKGALDTFALVNFF